MKRSDLRRMIVKEMKAIKEEKAYGQMPNKQADGIDKLNEAWDLFDEVEDAYKSYCKNWGGQNRYSVKTPIIEKGVVVGSSNRKFTQKEFIEKIKTDDEFAEKFNVIKRR